MLRARFLKSVIIAIKMLRPRKEKEELHREKRLHNLLIAKRFQATTKKDFADDAHLKSKEQRPI